MPLEAVMICVDNSDFTRNGDYAPTRFESQTDAVNLVCGAKTQQNPENAVGLLVTAGDRIEVMITPTTDLGTIISQVPKMTIGGSSDVLRGIQTAQLALKHRQNKNQKQRIIAFIGSPIFSTEKELETLGKNLKKNNVSLDLVSFGEVEENTAKLEKLLTAVNSNDSSHMVEVPVGPKLLSDVLLSSVIISPDGEAPAGGGDFGEFGINPTDDPELALALRISMEEEKARMERVAGEGAAAAPAAAGGAAPAAAAGAAPAPAAAAPAAGGTALPTASDADVMAAMGMEDMDDELRQALLLSMQEAEPDKAGAPAPAAAPTAAPVAAAPAAAAPATVAGAMEGMEDMDEELRQALLLSMQEAEGDKAAPMAVDADAGKKAEPAAAAKSEGEASVDEACQKWLQDPDFVQELLGSLPGVDINDPKIQNALKEATGDEKKEGDGKGGGSGSGSSGSK